MISIEEQLGICVKNLGGEVLDEILSEPREFENADYLFRGDRVIAELKRIEKSVINNPKFQSEASDLYEKWVREGRPVPQVFGRKVRVNTSDLPPECAFEFFGLIKNRLQPILRKANKQIRTTREWLGPTDALGLVLLAIDGDSGLTVETILHVVDRTLRGAGLTSINGIILFSACHSVGSVGGLPACPWLSAYKDDRDAIDPEFLAKLRDAWMNRMATLLGHPLIVWDGTSSDEKDLLLQQRIRPIRNE